MAEAAIDPRGNLYVVDAGNDRIQIFSPDGDFLEVWDGTSGGGERFSYLKANGGLDGDIDFGSDGTIYVTEPGVDGLRVQVFDLNHTFIEAWDSFGAGDGQFIEPFSIATDAEGNVYVLDGQRFDVQKFDAAGNFLVAFGGPGGEEGQLSNPGYIAADSQGHVFIADAGSHSIVKFASDGTFLAQWEIAGGQPGAVEILYPTDVTVDDAGNVYVADFDNGRIQVFDANGGYLTEWDAGTTPAGSRNLPYALALDGSGALYVMGTASDYESESNVQKFALPRTLEVTATPVS